MKKIYQIPTLQVEQVAVKDVIATSTSKPPQIGNGGSYTVGPEIVGGTSWGDWI